MQGQCVADFEEDEGASPRPMTAPLRPTRAMIESHEVAHLPFRSWCSACVRARAQAQAHWAQTRMPEEQAIPLISIDYGFFGAPPAEGSEGVSDRDLPVLVVKDRKSKALWCIPVPEKGIGHPWSVAALKRVLESTGYRRIILKSDGERSIQALAAAVKAEWKGEIVPETSPKGAHQSNGEAEAAVKAAHGLARTLK